MSYEILIGRVEERRLAKGWSERKMLVTAGVGEKTLYSIKQGHAPKPITLYKLAQALGVPPAYFLEAAAQVTAQPELQARRKLETIYVKGAVQAGAWREAVEWDPPDWYSVIVPTSRNYPGYERYGLEVRGTSMNRVFAEGTVVLVVKFDALARLPKSGEHVVVLRRDRSSSDYEATLKEYQQDQAGRHILWPRSDDPEFQAPIVLEANALPVSDGTEQLPEVVFAGGGLTTAGVEDLIISALVVSTYSDV